MLNLTLSMQPSPMTLSVITASLIVVGGRYRGMVYKGESLSEKLLERVESFC